MKKVLKSIVLAASVLGLASVPIQAQHFRVFLGAPILFTEPSPLDIVLDPSIPNRVDEGESYSGILSIDGGQPGYDVDIGGMLPPGLSLSGTTLSGTFSQLGSYSFSFLAEDSQGVEGWSNTFSVEVVPPLEMAYAQSDLTTRINRVVDLPAPQVTGGLSDYSIVVESGSLPLGVEIDEHGAITGSPLVSGSGNVHLAAVDDDGRRSAPVTITWTIHPELAASQESMTAPQGILFESAAPETIGDDGSLTWELAEGALPDGLSLDATTGTIRGTASSAGDALGVVLRVSDGIDHAFTPPFDVRIEVPIVASVSESATDLIASTLFSSEEWSSSTIKVVRIEPGVVIGGTSTSAAALTTGTGWGGGLVIEINGSIEGRGGAANGGTGSTVQSIGTYTGWQYDRTSGSGTYCWRSYGEQRIYWNGGLIANGGTGTIRSGYRYDCGALLHDSFPSLELWQIRRAPVTTAPSAGGTGGAGGRGQGYEQTRTAGSTGAAGVSGSGAGGTGGDGGLWGANGSRGADGVNGNSGTGASGSNGGAAGAAILNTRFLTSIVNHGTISGRQDH